MVKVFPLDKSKRIYVAGHAGMVGSAIWRLLSSLGYENLVGWTSRELNLTNREETISKVSEARPEVIFMAAARVGGIGSNSQYPVEFLTENTRIQNNVFEVANQLGVERLLFLGSSCIYPKYAEQPIKESSLMTGMLEPTNDAYAIAKIAGLLHVQAHRREYGRRWISVMPTNLYGPFDNFNPETGHVLPSLIWKFHEAKVSKADQVTLWGDGTALREFLHVDDLAKACLAMMSVYDEDEPINVGFGSDITIRELANRIASVVGFTGEIVWDSTKPNGTPRKLLDSTRILNLGWKPEQDLDKGLQSTYQWFLKHEWDS
jgi:GDP-L-fucose synthase